jgi:hypothetical protein
VRCCLRVALDLLPFLEGPVEVGALVRVLAVGAGCSSWVSR